MGVKRTIHHMGYEYTTLSLSLFVRVKTFDQWGKGGECSTDPTVSPTAAREGPCFINGSDLAAWRDEKCSALLAPAILRRARVKITMGATAVNESAFFLFFLSKYMEKELVSVACYDSPGRERKKK